MVYDTNEILKQNKSGQLSRKIELSALMENRRVISNYFDNDL